MPIRKYGGTSTPSNTASVAPKAQPPLPAPEPTPIHTDAPCAAVPVQNDPQEHYDYKEDPLRTTQDQKALYAILKTTPVIPELSQPNMRFIRPYQEGTIEETLYSLIDRNDVIMVAGAFFGDEGKGKTVDAVCRHPKCTCIARVNSGENAGHTVIDQKGRKYIFNLAPSGLLTEGKRNYIGPECVMDPINFMRKEVKQLMDGGVNYKDRLFIGNVCIVTPYHKLIDLVNSPPNSSTLKGMSPVHASKVTKRGIRLDHIFNDERVLRERLYKDMATYLALLNHKQLTDAMVVQMCMEANSDGVERIPDYVMAFAAAEDKVDFLVRLYHTQVRDNDLFPPRCDVIFELRQALEEGGKILLEGPQSYWLSNSREKFWESTTSADTSASGLLATSLVNFQRYRSVVINVHKAPGSSRVGIGACPSSFVPQDFFSSKKINTLNDFPSNMCVNFDKIQRLFFNEAFHNIGDPKQFNGIAEPIEYADETGQYNIAVAMAIASSRHHGECGSVTKKPRICGFFDCVLHHEVNAVQGPYLSISALDRGDDYDRVGVTIAYIYYNKKGDSLNANGRVYKNGDIIKAGDPVPTESVLYHCYPIVKLIDGWKNSPIAAGKRSPNTPLPRGVSEFIATVEYFTKAKVISIGNGPRCSDIIYIKS